MTRHFTIRKMLRMTPNSLLQEFFRRLGNRLLWICDKISYPNQGEGRIV